MVSTQSSLKRETPFKGFNPPPTTTTDTDTLQQINKTNKTSKTKEHSPPILKQHIVLNVAQLKD